MEQNEETNQENVKPTPTLDEVRQATEDFKREADRLEKLQANQMLAGTAGIRPEMPVKKELTAKEYKDYIEKYGKPPE